ncbi:aminopeptidase P family protein [Aerosakkonema sp. BLCC-F183]|uniref:aminopeptidase P family protein n=1 Tax=Aerosakkonema sp. BLCC-F183 TaxID=3342834 RepID=UPI0035B81B09
MMQVTTEMPIALDIASLTASLKNSHSDTLGEAKTLADTLRKRRKRLFELIDFPVVLWSGCAPSRNYPANKLPFRASSHFLYFAGLPLENAAIRMEAGRLELFVDDPNPEDSLWHGKQPTREEIAELIGANTAHPMGELRWRSQGCATIPVQDVMLNHQQSGILNRWLYSASSLSWIDWDLAYAIVKLRLQQDAGALTELRKAAATTVDAHKSGMAGTRHCKTEAEVRSAMESVIIARNMTCAYNSIVTVRGEVLHNDRYHNPLQPGDLLLADVGAETAMGWASDVTRTWPVSGRFSPTQRAIYEVVLAARDACISKIRPGVEYKDIHMLAATTLTQGLLDLGIMKGDVEELVEMDAHTAFFPHGVGHPIGLDVHDMEDLGDLAGYELGRIRSDRPGLKFLRLDRPLQAGMLVSIEPGFYQVPSLLNYPDKREQYQEVVDWDRLAEFSDVRGIRIEDDVLVTESGSEVITADLPSHPDAIEHFMGG